MQREPEGIEGHPTWSLLLTVTRAEAYSQPPFTPFEALSHPAPSAVSADPLSPSARSPPPPATPRAQARGDVSSAPEPSAGNSAAGALCATVAPAEHSALLGAAQQQAQLQGAAHPAQQVLLPLLLVAEATEGSANPHCDYCRSSGWCHHPIAAHKYHFIIPAKNPHSHPRAESQVLATTASSMSPRGTRSTTSTSNHHPSSHHNQHHHTSITAAACRSQSLAAPTHLLHGVIHTNGFGHLVTLNGRAAGSHVLSGRQLMQLWDNICTMLRAREVSVEDLSHKLSFSSDYRLLHTLAFSHSWFARWGYSFAHGAFGITQHRYSQAVARVAGTRLLPLLQQLRGINTGIASRVAAVVAKYQSHVVGNKCLSEDQSEGENRRTSLCPHVLDASHETHHDHHHLPHAPHFSHGPHSPHAAPPNLTLQHLFSSLLALRSSLPLPLHHQHHHFPHLLHPSSLPLPLTLTTPTPPTAPSTPAAAAAAPLAAVPSLASSRSPLLSFSARHLLAPPPPLTLPPLFPPLQPMAARQLSGEPSPTSASCLSDELSPRQQQQRLLHQQQQQALPSPVPPISYQQMDVPPSPNVPTPSTITPGTQVIVDVLSLRPGAWLPRHEVREAARQRIGDTGLLDFVLKSLGNRLVGDVVVRRAINPLSKVLEFSLEPLQREGGERGGGGGGEGREGVVGEEGRGGLEGQQGEVPMGPVSPLTLNGAVDLGGDQRRIDARDADTARDWSIPPPELITLPPEATVSDLKAAACRASPRPTLWLGTCSIALPSSAALSPISLFPLLPYLQVTALPEDLADLDDDDVLFGSLDSGASLLLAISSLDAHSEWRYEGGNDTWAVRCVCGARDDDGERMIAAVQKDLCREVKVDCGEKKGARRVVKSEQTLLSHGGSGSRQRQGVGQKRRRDRERDGGCSEDFLGAFECSEEREEVGEGEEDEEGGAGGDGRGSG
ncbi:unnamed protein product [Closterium sp. NIES-65]|nr:unnamed protein product [Closterium sp. NIES-65]